MERALRMLKTGACWEGLRTAAGGPGHTFCRARRLDEEVRTTSRIFRARGLSRRHAPRLRSGTPVSADLESEQELRRGGVARRTDEVCARQGAGRAAAFHSDSRAPDIKGTGWASRFSKTWFSRTSIRCFRVQRSGAPIYFESCGTPTSRSSRTRPTTCSRRWTEAFASVDAARCRSSRLMPECPRGYSISSPRISRSAMT